MYRYKSIAGGSTVIVPDRIEGKETRVVYADAFDFTAVKKIIIPRKTFFNKTRVVRAGVVVEYK